MTFRIAIFRCIETGYLFSEAFAFGAFADVEVGDFFNGIDDPVLIEAGTSDAADAGVLRARSAERKLVILHAAPVDAQYADMPGMMVTAGIDAAGNL